MPERPRPDLFPSAPPPASPCIRNCCLREDDICLGCFRSLEEITAWGTASDERKSEILKHALRRKQKATL
jgi:predicted Fe-S protein YdhL (DUF1289 family)